MTKNLYHPRALEAAITQTSQTQHATLILGPRGVGKKTLVNRLLVGQSTFTLSGKNNQDVAILSDPESYLTLSRHWANIVIHDATCVPNIGEVIKRMVDTNEHGTRLFVTSHTDLALAKDNHEIAVDHIETFQLWPLSLEELSDEKNHTELKCPLKDILVYGSHPQVLSAPRDAEAYLHQRLDAFFYSELLCLGSVRKPLELIRLTRFLAAHVGQEIRYGTVAKTLGIENKTIERYVELLANFFLIYIVPSWSQDHPRELKASRKIYFYDNGIRNALLNDFKPWAARNDQDALWENLFVTERLKHHSHCRNGGEMFFWRTREHHQIDFLERVNGVITGYQCDVGSKSDSKVKERSIKTFHRAYPNIPVRVIRTDDF